MIQSQIKYSLEQLPDHTRVWIYQSDRLLSEEEQQKATELLDRFMGEWSAHGSKLTCGFSILHDHFLVVGVDEESLQASGCSIDSSVRFIQELGRHIGADFFRRDNLAYETGNGDIKLASLPQIPAMVEANEITPETMVYNNLVPKKQNLSKNWRVYASDTWVKRYFS